jgi:hypothetical protein
MAINLSDIEFFLSGGSSNSNPALSLGGAPSGFVILGTLNNLFSNVTSEQAESGRTDYRCFYVFNGSETDSLLDSEIFLESQDAGGSRAQIGVEKSTEVQRIGIVGPAYFGSLTLRYDSQVFVANWGTSAGQFEANLQSELVDIGLDGVSVSTVVSGNNYSFTISFFGASDNRSHPLLEVVQNGLLAPSTPTVSISRVSSGAPVNSVATQLSVDTVPPARVVFSDSKIAIGTLAPGDGVPVWVKRVTSAGTEYQERDGFNFRISGKPF